MTTTADAATRRRVLIFMAPVGDGHLAAAHGVRRALEQAGHEATIVDGLAAMSRPLNWISVNLYGWQLAHAPWSYDLAFRALGLPAIARLVRGAVGLLWADRLWDVIAPARPDAIVSTYPTATAALGHLRQDGRLGVPVVAVVTDYGAHPMWASPDIDLHFAPARLSAARIEAIGGRAAVMRPPVADAYFAPPTRGEARAALGLPATAFIPLIVGGAWGVGALEEAAACAIAAGAFPVVVTGRNAALKTRLAQRFSDEPSARVLGWTDQLPLLMAASDCLIQHAGGMSCLEAAAMGRPIVFYRPIAGHGRLNAAAMKLAGAASQVGSPSALEHVLRRAREGTHALTPPAVDPGAEVAETVLAMTSHPAGPGAWSGAPSRSRLPALRSAVGGATGLGALAVIGKDIANGARAAMALPVLALWMTLLAGFAAGLVWLTASQRSAARDHEVAGGAHGEAVASTLTWMIAVLLVVGTAAALEWRYPAL